jgi:hypothetical protein
MPRLCSIEGCDRPHWVKGNCRVHHERIKKWGHPDGGPTTHAPPEVRFWRYVDKRGPDECWPWTGKRQKSGYGRFGIGQHKKVGAHRFSFEMATGFLPPVVMHTCDNPPCVNPAHLRAATNKLNTADMIVKGRSPMIGRGGEDHPRVRLTENQVRDIRSRRGQTQASLAREFGVSTGAIEGIVKRRTWKHIT